MTEKLKIITGNCLVIHPDLPLSYTSDTGGDRHRDTSALLAEAVSLSAAIRLNVAAADIVRVARPSPSHLIGTGARDHVRTMIAEHAPELVIINHALTPVQQRNLETDWDVKVIDRTGLILEIFGDRAQSAEGKIQVELAALQYRRARLVRTWTHLERQRGGTSGIGGPGETQLEIDRRLIDDKIARLKRDLETVAARRDLERAGRDKIPFKTVAIVGYTNAGKSTLFNRLTGADVFAQDLLFATLDTTMRRLKLPHGETVILSDTVGFISDLPTGLVAAFRATLDQVQYADVILHVRDATAPDFRAQGDDVMAIMNDLGINAAEDPRMIEVWNKIDLIDPPHVIPGAPAPSNAQAPATRDLHQDMNPQKVPGLHFAAPGMTKSPIRVSAHTGAGFDALYAAIEGKISAGYENHTVKIPVADGAHIAWIHAHARVVNTHLNDDNIMEMTITIDPANWGKWTERMRRGGSKNT